jgi:hypothetical protein
VCEHLDCASNKTKGGLRVYQLDAASYVADIVTFALKAPFKTWFVKTMLRTLGLRRSR